MSQSLETGTGAERELVQVGEHGLSYYATATCPLAGSYASVEDFFDISVPDNAAYDFPTRTVQRVLRIASRRIDTFLGQRFKVPLQFHSETVVWATCEIAFNMAMARRGHDPEAKTERTTDSREAKAWEWVRAARDYEVTPDAPLANQAPGATQQDVLSQESQPVRMVSDPVRGWDGERLRGARGPVRRLIPGRFF